jgi:hypothetical protein
MRRYSEREVEKIYFDRRDACFAAVRSFKYPYTRITSFVAPFCSRLIARITDAVQTLRLYEMSYVIVRTVDDIADEGDIDKGSNHLRKIIEFIENDTEPEHENEILLQYIFDTARIVRRDTAVLEKAFLNIFRCVESDVQRRRLALSGTPCIRSEKEVRDYIEVMEYQGIFRLIFELFGESEEEHKKIWPLVEAGRLHFYLLRDAVEDIAAGLINIPDTFLPDDLDRMILFCVRLEEYKDRNMNERLYKIKKLVEEFPSIYPWVSDQIEKGVNKLEEYKKGRKTCASWRTKILLWGSFRRTKKFFRLARKILIK